MSSSYPPPGQPGEGPDPYGQGQGQYGQNPGQHGQGQYGQNPGQYGQNPGQYGQNPGQYGQNPGQHGEYGSGAPARPRNGLGTVALVLGVVGILLSWTVIGGILLGIAAIVLGFMGRSRAKQGQATNGGVALAGIITGVVALVLGALMIALSAWFFNQLGFGDLQQCLEEAGQDPAAVEQCQLDYQGQLEEQFGTTS